MDTTTKEHTVEMDPKTTMEQIGRMTLMGIGARRFQHDGDTLRFTISRGHRVVDVVLDPSDTYTVRTTMKRSGRVVFEVSGLYFDQLPEQVWQSHIER